MLKIVGDISLTDGYFDVGFGIGSKLKEGFDPFKYIQRNADDCWIGNFEGVASDTSVRNNCSSKQFRVKPKYLSHLKHFNLYGLANNHVMQHGAIAYENTLSYLTSLGCKCFGSIQYKTQIIMHQDKLVSITGFSQRIDAFSTEPCYWHNPEYCEIEEEIERIPHNAFKIVFVHWGNEFINRPSIPQKCFAHWLVDAGFDLVIGMHPHVLQGYEQYHGKYIFYSLGNFVFHMAWEPTKYGVIINIDLSKYEISPEIEYIKINSEFAPEPINKLLVPKEFRFDYLNEQLKINENTEEYHAKIVSFYKQYRYANHKNILKNMLLHPAIIKSTIQDYIKRRL